jgi:hypothetical protein
VPSACSLVKALGTSASTLDLMSMESESISGISNPAIIDLFAVDQKTDQVVLAMHEPRPWDGSDERLHELQEKFNAYVSFLLDGEMLAAHPELAGKPARIEIRCDYMPDDRALGLLELIHGQLALQEIKMEVVVAQKDDCGDACSCHGN